MLVLESSMRKRYINIMKFIAVLLVLNSHMDAIYPIASLATGGSIGNALFFFVSGYTWYNAKKEPFCKWYLRKVKLIWCPTLITNLIYIIIFKIKFDLKQLFLIFIFPNKSWFCGAILAYAIVYYFVVKSDNYKKIYYSILCLIIVYFIYYLFFLDKSVFSIESFRINNFCRSSFYLICMFMGLLYRKKSNSTMTRKNLLLKSVTYFLLIYLFKYFMTKFTFLLLFQFLSQLFTILFVISLFLLLSSLEIRLQKIRKFELIELVSNFSWEVYLVQTLIIPLCINILFPFSFFVSIVLIVICSFVLKKISKLLFDY